MEYTYEILTLAPKAEFISIRYSHDGYPDYFYRHTPQNFSEEHIEFVIKCGANLAVQFWERVEKHPEEVNIERKGTKTWEDPVSMSQPPIQEPEPEYNPLTHYIQQKITEGNPTLGTPTIFGWEVIEKTYEQKLESVRMRRTWLLNGTDWMVLPDSPEPSQEWLDYRQALRDVPLQEGFPDNVIWPKEPTE